MAAVKKIDLVSVDDYLAGELDSDIRHEYLGGYIYAMAGARNVHNTIATNFLLSVGQQLRGKPCQAFNSDTKVRIQYPTHTRFYYPDGMVVCKPNSSNETFQDHPVVIAEVVSDATRRTDEGEKRDAYLSIPTLMVYMIIETDKPRIAVYRRTDQGFVTELYEGITSAIPLDEIQATLSFAELYERVEFQPAAR